MRPLRKIGIGSGLALLFGTLGAIGASPAFAANVSCGQTITVNTVLNGDVLGCSQGITIGANNITFDLNHFTISGTPAIGEGPGILLRGRTGVTVKNGTVTLFDAGVSVEGGSTNNRVQNMRAIQNVGSLVTDYGDGILLADAGTSGNTVNGNVVRGNGPYDGIGLLGRVSGNTVTSNAVELNNEPSRNGAGVAQVNQDAGIRVEGGGAVNNTIMFNSVSGSGLDGITVLRANPANTGNTIIRNSVHDNGFNSLNRQGHGIVLFGGSTAAVNADSETVQFNTVKNNAADGIRVESRNNQLLTNTASGNAAIDLRDTNAACDNNAWHGNHGVTFTPACTLNP